MSKDNSGSLRLYLIRHGETEWSVSGQYAGRTDLPLTTRGEAAAREVGRRLQHIPFTQVLTSPLQRAQQTCALAGLRLAPEIEPNLEEWSHGDYEGRTPAQIRESTLAGTSSGTALRMVNSLLRLRSRSGTFPSMDSLPTPTTVGHDEGRQAGN